MMSSPSNHARVAGNTYSEYMLVAFLVLVSSVGLWMALGQSLNGVAVKLKGEFKHRSDAAVLARANANGDGSPVVTNSLGTSSSNGSNNSPMMNCTINPSSGMPQCIVQNPPPVTLGGNGDNIQATIFNWMINFLKSLGFDVQVDSNTLLSRLASQGHQVAFLQQVVAALQGYTASDVSRLKNTTIMIEGKPYTVQALVDMLNSLTDQVQQQQQDLQQSNLPQDTIDQTQQNTSTIVQSGQQTATSTQTALNQPDPDPTTGTTTSDPSSTTSTPSTTTSDPSSTTSSSSNTTPSAPSTTTTPTTTPPPTTTNTPTTTPTTSTTTTPSSSTSSSATGGTGSGASSSSSSTGGSSGTGTDSTSTGSSPDNNDLANQTNNASDGICQKITDEVQRQKCLDNRYNGGNSNTHGPQ